MNTVCLPCCPICGNREPRFPVLDDWTGWVFCSNCFSDVKLFATGRDGLTDLFSDWLRGIADTRNLPGYVQDRERNDCESKMKKLSSRRMSTVQAAILIGCSPGQVRTLIRTKKIKAERHEHPYQSSYYYTIERKEAIRYRDKEQCGGFPRGKSRK